MQSGQKVAVHVSRLVVLQHGAPCIFTQQEVLLPDGALDFHGLDDGSHILDLGSGHCLAAIRFLEILFVAAAGRPFHSFL